MVRDLPVEVGRPAESIKTSNDVASKYAEPALASQKPKKRGSSFFAKVRSVFKEFDQAKPSHQHRDPERLHVSTTDPPISPPHSPTAQSHVELGQFEFERGNLLEPDHGRLVGEGATGFLILTPSNSSVDNGRKNSVQPVFPSATEVVTQRLRRSSSSTLGECAHSLPEASDERKPEPSQVPKSPSGGLDIRALKLSSSTSDSEREGVHIALANYLSALCKDSVLSCSPALINFFTTRPSDLEHQSNKQHNLACRNTGIIASDREQDDDSTPIAFKGETSMMENSSPRRVRSAEDGITGTDFSAGIDTNSNSHDCLKGHRQVLADVSVSHLAVEPGSMARASSYGQQEGGMRGLGAHTLLNGSTYQQSADIHVTEHSAIPIQKYGANGSVDVPPKVIARRPLTVDDFDLIRTLGKGCAGKVCPPMCRM